MSLFGRVLLILILFHKRCSLYPDPKPVVMIQTPVLMCLSTLIYIAKHQFIQYISFFGCILCSDSPIKITCKMLFVSTFGGITEKGHFVPWKRIVMHFLIKHYMSKLRLFRLYRSSLYERIRLAVCRLFRTCALRNNRAVPAKDWPAGDRCGSRRRKPGQHS